MSGGGSGQQTTLRNRDLKTGVVTQNPLWLRCPSLQRSWRCALHVPSKQNPRIPLTPCAYTIALRILSQGNWVNIPSQTCFIHLQRSQDNCRGSGSPRQEIVLGFTSENGVPAGDSLICKASWAGPQLTTHHRLSITAPGQSKGSRDRMVPQGPRCYPDAQGPLSPYSFGCTLLQIFG